MIVEKKSALKKSSPKSSSEVCKLSSASEKKKISFHRKKNQLENNHPEKVPISSKKK